ncbi:hypothetical protein FBUS_03202 [Fasciolopsis buskii]|uniref:G-protein coupled receptors family 2 profile 1 domain-containing protein n=1 Tax=Fasciolopsis buskii TaxID=27845 RepID=A0A8E0RSH6_9TREM|nr:hypothetical protein FBUS_03202 [Fasciolopsis buski]
MCWPTTPANETVHLPCPSYIGGVSVTGKAWRSCEHNPSNLDSNHSAQVDQWMFDATNYSECVEIDRDLKELSHHHHPNHHPHHHHHHQHSNHHHHQQPSSSAIIIIIIISPPHHHHQSSSFFPDQTPAFLKQSPSL